MSMYGDYVRERLGDDIVENATGFATYRYLNGYQVYIVDIYVHPDYRKTGAASALADSIVDLAKIRGCTELLGTVVPTASGSTDSLKVLLGYGMTLQGITDGLIVFRKDI